MLSYTAIKEILNFFLTTLLLTRNIKKTKNAYSLPVPPGYNLMSIHTIRRAIKLGQTKISNLEYTITIHKQIIWFQILTEKTEILRKTPHYEHKSIAVLQNKKHSKSEIGYRYPV